MSHLISRACMLTLPIIICLALWVPATYAVVKNVSVVDSDGNALANTKVTITFPNGETVEEETDDDGMLIYDFPEDGDYTIRYPGGSMAVTVSDGSCTAEGMYSIGGNPTICSVDSTIIDFDWSGTMIGGLDGNLPGGETLELTYGHP